MKYILAGFVLLLLAACQNSGPEKLVVDGHFTHAAGKKIMLAELPFNNPQRLVVDSATLDSSGHFSLVAIQQQEGMYQLFIQDGPGILLINDTTDITVEANADSLNHYKVSNSKASQSIRSLFDRLTLLEQRAGKVNAVADSIIKTKMPDSLAAPYVTARDKANKNIKEFLQAYLGMEKNGTALWYGLGVAAHFLAKDQWTAELQKAIASHPSHPGITLMKVGLAASQQQEAMGKHLLNKPIPDISLPDTSGKMVSIRSFKGKWLLVDFWASWCGPCRRDNPYVVAAYRQFRKKNFAIVGISLDDNKESWTKAIYKDSLNWTQLSDLKQWESKAATVYGFNALPFNVLVDTAGVAIAVNLHGEALAAQLKQVVK